MDSSSDVTMHRSEDLYSIFDEACRDSQSAVTDLTEHLHRLIVEYLSMSRDEVETRWFQGAAQLVQAIIDDDMCIVPKRDERQVPKGETHAVR